jgi:hypothetical protein
LLWVFESMLEVLLGGWSGIEGMVFVRLSDVWCKLKQWVFGMMLDIIPEYEKERARRV